MPTQIGSTVTDFDAGTPTSLTTSYTQAAGTNRVLVVQVATEGDEVVSGVTFDGVALTQEIFEAGSGRRSSLWYLINPTVTTANIVVTLASSADVGMIASSWEDVHQTTPFRASAGASGTGNPSVVVSSAVGDLVIDSFDQDDTSTGTPGSGQTQLAQFEVTGDFQMGSSTEAGASPNVTMDWTGFGSDDFSQVAGSLQPPAGTPPTVDAGGPYNGDVDVATALNATVTPGTDPTPVLLWTIFSGPGGGVFSNDAIEDPTFTPDTVGAYVLQLSADPNDGPPVLDTANFESDDVPPVVDAGGPYNGDVSTAIPLDATVTPGSDPTPVLLWTIDSGPGGGVFSSDSIEDPTFTPDTVGSYVLRLTATPSDGPAVFDTANLESDPVFVAPTVDAGGPYNGPSGQATALDATVTPGTDPTPVLLWTIDSGGAGSFSNDAIEDPTFTPTFPTVGPYVLRLTVTPSDGPAVFDTANFESDPVAPTVDAGGPYAGDVATPIALNGTVTPGTDPAPTLLWTIDSGGTGTFSDDTIEDPTFTADGIGAYVLRLTVTPSDGPDVFDTAALTTAALADAVFLGGRLLRGGTGDLVMSQLSLGADPPGGDVVFIKGTAHSNAGAMYVALDDGVVSRVHIAGIAHQQNGVRLVTFDPPLVSLNAWGLDANGAQGVATSGAGQPHEGVLLRGDGQTVVDGVAPGPPPPPVPPLLSDLLHWFDFADISVLWQDAAGTIPIVPGQDVIRVDNKGTDGTPLIEAFPPGGIWTLALVNGLAGLVNNTNFSASQQTGWLGAGGAVASMAFSWGRRTDNLVNVSTGVMWQQSGGGGDDQLRGDSVVFPPGDWAVAVNGIPTPTSTTRAIVNNEWNWIYQGADNLGVITYRASGSPKQTAGGYGGPSGPPSTMSWGLPRGEQIEILVYGRGLTAAEQSLVTAYFDARAGATLPF